MTENKQPSITNRIRALAAAGHSRAEIARMVDRSYQQVRQVLVGDEARSRRAAGEAPPLFRETSVDDTLPRMADRAISQVDVSDLGTNKSAKIRRYAAMGFSRSAIASHLGIKYQFVRNVLVALGASEVNSRGQPAPAAVLGMAEPAARYDAGIPLPARLSIDGTGRIQLPPEWQLPAGATFVARKFDGSIVLMDIADASAAARTGGSLKSATDELIAERRLEAMREFDD
ncbi:hypothetical protein [Brevundimonas sp.]|uniref:hypothetical protein n=1 Tax=Brevundimonas sp. TaxID=1871086 RepID=UPI003F6F47C6